MKITSKTQLLCQFFLGMGLLSVLAAQPDQRLDGIWVGTETLTPTSSVNADQQKKIPQPYSTTIAIAKGGTMLGKIRGVCFGRFDRVQAAGSTLTCGAGDCH